MKLPPSSMMNTVVWARVPRSKDIAMPSISNKCAAVECMVDDLRLDLSRVRKFRRVCGDLAEYFNISVDALPPKLDGESPSK